MAVIPSAFEHTFNILKQKCVVLMHEMADESKVNLYSQEIRSITWEGEVIDFRNTTHICKLRTLINEIAMSTNDVTGYSSTGLLRSSTNDVTGYSSTSLLRSPVINNPEYERKVRELTTDLAWMLSELTQKQVQQHVLETMPSLTTRVANLEKEVVRLQTLTARKPGWFGSASDMQSLIARIEKL